jgi:hypothetical protein
MTRRPGPKWIGAVSFQNRREEIKMKTRSVLYSIAIGGFIGAFLCMVFLWASPAKATPVQDSTYLMLLAASDINYGSADAAIAQGHAICVDIDNGYDGEQEAWRVIRYTNVKNIYQARLAVLAAVTAYCPQFDHRGEGRMAA